MAQILDGKIVRDQIAQDLTAQIAKLDQKPELVIFQIGDVAESNTYIGQKIKFGEKIGAVVAHKKLPTDIPQHELLKEIQLANEDENVSGIILQLPIPESLDKEAIIDAIDPKKDVDGQTSRSVKALFDDAPIFIPATTKGILSLLNHYKIPVEGKHVVVIGRSTIVGKPTALAFLNTNATVTVCHKKTKDMASITKSADILVVAVGKANLIGKEHVKSGQVVIDVGINVQARSGSDPDQGPTLSEKRKLIGDVNFEQVEKIVAAITPVPGGVGPMTVASLFQNLLAAYLFQNK